ncbi:choline/ethanolamine kinase family protein [Oharaeibacter diazotrophicus]|uniref:Thiamine kinase-like enzyme n=1 Tax=Oharaeibacter diazotrophicus TaxID=1920512 RepID=A0A4R6RIT9_9HYPH|nr:choline/ethanolamine kinase family protein [Oharaeibacter diazotrophicus]TDP86294.1 thiamine kinase-like enzyme [Oharaeibacter diazotrophicus]BBE71763.1 phosphotransferase enzyme family protein [Pleomorphomonas sp. SM30]GLS78529.1 choline kinase [Oharaeibacter diazotrophicus]
MDAETRIRALPIWSGPIAVRPVGGGLSNSNYAVTDAGRTVMVRLGDDLPFHHVFRDREVAVSRAAHAAGLSPAVVHAEPGVSVFEFLTARTYTADDVRANRGRIVEMVRRLHADVARHLVGPAPFFWVFHVVRDYAATLTAKGSRMADRVAEFVAIADRLEAMQVPLPLVFGHHDLLPANIMDDGTRLWLVDWEYGGFGTPLFDLANLAGNAGFSRDEELDLLDGYFGRAPEPALVRAFDAMKAASLLREAMWSLVSELTLNAPGADYEAYTAANLGRLEEALASLEERP